MFARATSSIFVLALPLLAAATALPRNPSQCASGSLLCCSSLQPLNATPGASTILGLLNIVVSNINGQIIGLTCSPITVVSVSGTSCDSDQQPEAACCTDNSHNGIIALGCTPVNL